MALDLESSCLRGQRFSNGWNADDFLPAASDAVEVIDPWVPPVEQVSREFAWPPAFSTSELLGGLDPWCSINTADTRLYGFGQEKDHWSDAIDLPKFDPQAFRHLWSLDHLDEPFARDPASKASWVVATFRPATPRSRTKWTRVFEAIFLERPGDRFFKKVRTLAASSETPESLVGAVGLRFLWEDRADLRQIRVSTKRGTAYTQGPNLPWKAALQIATARCDFDLDDMVDDGWLNDWRQLKVGASGYWSFAEYACLRAQHERFEDWDFAAALSREEALWEGTRYTRADDRSGTTVRIRQPRPPASTELARRFQEWREKQDYLLQKVELKTPPIRIATLPICAAPTPSPTRLSFNEEFESLFAALRDEMQTTLHMTNHPSALDGHPHKQSPPTLNGPIPDPVQSLQPDSSS